MTSLGLSLALSCSRGFNNCVRADSLYAICCRSPCERLMNVLEEKATGVTSIDDGHTHTHTHPHTHMTWCWFVMLLMLVISCNACVCWAACVEHVLSLSRLWHGFVGTTCLKCVGHFSMRKGNAIRKASRIYIFLQWPQALSLNNA